MTLLFQLFLLILTAYLAVQVAYLLFFSLAGHLKRPQVFTKADDQRKIKVFIPGYKEDKVILETARVALAQDYPKDKYEVIVIADQFSNETLQELRQMPLTVVEVFFEKSTKGKALHYALEKTRNDEADIALILDADNHMTEGFLHAINDAFSAGYRVVQAHRVAKHPKSAFALLDACTEEINNHIFRRGHVAIGLPSALIGSGMAFEMTLFEEIMENIGETAGEDKELEIRIVRQQIPVAFLDKSLVLDEKVANTAVFAKQRSRWLATQVEFLEKYFAESWTQLFRGNVAFFNKIFQTYLLPRVLLVVLSIITLFLSAFSKEGLFQINLLLFILLALSLFMGIPKAYYNRQLLTAFLQIPGAILGIFKSMAGIKVARKKFIHTPHGETL